MARYRTELVIQECIACGNCTMVCPDFWEMEEEHSHLKGSNRIEDREDLEIDDAGCNLEAADSCPVNCIHVYEEDRKLI